MDKNLENVNEFDYTIVLDADYSGLDMQEPVRIADGSEGGSDDGREAVDRLYSEYEKMCLQEPTVLDEDDAYPHSYQWRVADRYDPAKVEILEEALKESIKVADTEAYHRYVEEIKNHKFTPDSWD